MLFHHKKRGFKNLIAAFCCIFLISTTAFAQSNDDDAPDTPQNVLKINLGSLFFAHANIAYQRGISKHFSAQIAGMYGTLDLPIDVKQFIGFNVPYIKSVNYEGWGVVPTVRYYPLNVTSAPRGWYLEAFYQYREARIKNCVDEQFVSNPKQYTVNLNFKYTGIGVGTGYQFMFGRNKNIVIDASVGVKYSNVSVRAGWDGVVRFDPIANPAGGYWVTPDEATDVENFINKELVNKVNKQELGLGFLSTVDVFRSALYVGYAF